MDIKSFWNTSLLVEMEIAISKPTFNVWMKGTEVVKFDDGVVHVAVPSIFIRDGIKTRFHKQILKLLRDFSDSVRSVEYVISKGGEKKPADNNYKANALDGTTKELSITPDMYINKDDNLNPRYTFDSFVVGPFNELAYAASQAIIKKPVVYNPLFIYGDTGRGKTHLLTSGRESHQAQ